MVSRESPRASGLRCLAVLVAATCGMAGVLRLLTADLSAAAGIPGELRDPTDAAALTLPEVLVAISAVVLAATLVWLWVVTVATCLEAATRLRVPIGSIGSARIRGIVLLACGMTLAAGMAPAGASAGSPVPVSGERDVLAGLPLPDRARTPANVDADPAEPTGTIPQAGDNGSEPAGHQTAEPTPAQPTPAAPTPAEPDPAEPDPATSASRTETGQAGQEQAGQEQAGQEQSGQPARPDSPSTSPRPSIGTVSPGPGSQRVEHDESDVPDHVEAPATARTAPLTVTVRPGDTLWALAASGLPADARDTEINRRWRQIWDQNHAHIGPDPDRIIPGTALTMPTPTPSQENR